MDHCQPSPLPRCRLISLPNWAVSLINQPCPVLSHIAGSSHSGPSGDMFPLKILQQHPSHSKFRKPKFKSSLLEIPWCSSPEWPDEFAVSSTVCKHSIPPHTRQHSSAVGYLVNSHSGNGEVESLWAWPSFDLHFLGGSCWWACLCLISGHMSSIHLSGSLVLFFVLWIVSLSSRG